MKKLIFVMALFLSNLAHADLFDLTKSKEYTVSFSTPSSAAFSGTTNYILIDLTDTTNWPHKETGEISITSVYASMDKVAASTSSIRIGVLTHVNTSSGSVIWITPMYSAINASNTNVVFQYDYRDTGINARVRPNSNVILNGSTPYISTNDNTLGSTHYQSDLVLNTSIGTTAIPKEGDIILEIQKGAAAINFNVVVRYYSGRP